VKINLFNYRPAKLRKKTHPKIPNCTNSSCFSDAAEHHSAGLLSRPEIISAAATSPLFDGVALGARAGGSMDCCPRNPLLAGRNWTSWICIS
jgi:hypothetical protein